MGNCVIHEPPVWTKEIPKWDKQTDADGDAMGAVIELLANNAAYNKRETERMGGSVVVTIPVSGWSGSAPYTQAVSIPGMKSTDKIGIHLYAPKELAADAVKLRQKLTPMITDGESGDGKMTFYCGVKKPTADFQVLLTGVSGQGGV